MTSHQEQAAQRNQTTASENQNGNRPEIKVTFLPVAHTQASVLENIKQVRERIAEKVLKFDQNDLPQNLQTEIPKIAVLLQRIERLALETTETTRRKKKFSSLSSLVSSLDVALASLFQKKISKEFTRQIRLDVEQEVIRYEHLPILRLFVGQSLLVWHAKSVRLSVIYGLTGSFFLMFGSLFSLALIQYAAYSSHEDSKKNVAPAAQTARVASELEELQKQINRLTTQATTKPTSLSSIANNKGATPDAVLNVEASRIANFQQEVKETTANVIRLEANQSINPYIKQSSIDTENQSSFLKSVLANFYTGFSRNFGQILWVAAAGTLGSIVSILIRVIGESYDKKIYEDRLTPIFIGFFKPVIGASFGVLFLAFINSGVISTPLFPESVKAVGVDSTPKTADNSTPPIPESGKAVGADSTPKTADDSETKAVFFLFSVAFVVGFSERLAKDTITKLEGGSSASDEEGKGNKTRLVVVRSGKPVTPSTPDQQSSQPQQAAASIVDDGSV